jgi:hypothetical protein
MRDIWALFPAILFCTISIAAESGISSLEVPSSPLAVTAAQPFVTINYTFYASTPSTLYVTYTIEDTGEEVTRSFSVTGSEEHSFNWLVLKFPNSTFKPGIYHITARVEPLEGDTNASDNFVTTNLTIEGSGSQVGYFSISPENPLPGAELTFYVSVSNLGPETSYNITINDSIGILATRNVSVPSGFEMLVVLENVTMMGMGCENFTAEYGGNARKISLCDRHYLDRGTSAIPEYPWWAIILILIFAQMLGSQRTRENP